ncbi:hypothetical protein C8R44DRAFT_890666 [Mycena epipterygia]|nr:hypothetical protein C8R44DRAFT_890666 [Mycena epipterygia]
MTGFFPAASGTESVPVAASSPPPGSDLTSNTAMAASTIGTPAPLSPAPMPVAAPPAPMPVIAPAAPAPVPAPAATGFLTRGPWIAGSLYVVIPTGPLMLTAEDPPADPEEPPLWYCITAGRFVGVTLSNGMALAASQGVSNSQMKSHKTQALAVASFNELLGYNMVRVVVS